MIRLIFSFLIFLEILTFRPAFAAGATQALAVKSDRIVIFYDQDGQEILRASAAFGQARGQKTREGDLKTPEGDYTLYPARPSTEWDWFMPISYPNDADIARAKAAGQARHTMGGAIGLHSVGDGFMRNIRQGFGENWTWGCIAIRERDMNRVRDIVTDPIPLRIIP